MGFRAVGRSLPARGERSLAFALDPSLLLAVVAGFATLALHVATSGGYGYQRDELYFISCARHLAWGYVDQPPLIALVTALALKIFGGSLLGLRLLPALAAAATVVLTGRLARRLGGGVVAQGLGMLALALAPFYLAVGNLLTMNAFEPLLWLGAAYLIVRAAESDDLRWWIGLGIVVGLGFLNKYSTFFYIGCACAALALGPQRRLFTRPGFWLAVGLALALVVPNLVWQGTHGWPQLEVLRNAAADKNFVVGPLAFYVEQILMMNPLAAPLWIAGLGFVLFAPGGIALRWYGWTYLLLSALYLALQAKVYYLAPIYPALLAAGGVAVERVLRGRSALVWAYAALLLVVGLAIAPEAFPLLPLRTFLAYERVLDVRGIKMERHPEGRVPQHFADMLGWDTLVATLADAYRALPPNQRREAAILTHDYGQAAAVDFLGPKYGLPPAISGHNTYYLYGSRGYSGNVVLALGFDEATLRREFRRIERVGTFHDEYLLPDQNDLPILKCTDPARSLVSWWPTLKRYI